MEKITSSKNPKLALWRSLREHRTRKETGLFLVEGRKMTAEALASAFPVEAVLVAEGVSADVPDSVPVFELPERLFATLTETKTPQGIAAVVRETELPLSGTHLVALDGVQDPGNVGTILRTLDAAGLDGALLSPACADPYTPKVLRATMGSIFRTPVGLCADLSARLRKLKSEGYEILSSQLDGEPFYARAPIGDRWVLVIGNEGNGVTEPVRALATRRLRLPMRGGAESLNAAVAAGIMMYDLMR